MSKDRSAFSRTSALFRRYVPVDFMPGCRLARTATMLAFATTLTVSTLLPLARACVQTVRCLSDCKCSRLCSQPHAITHPNSRVRRITTRRHANRVPLRSLAVPGATVLRQPTVASPTMPPAHTCWLPQAFAETSASGLPLDLSVPRATGQIALRISVVGRRV
jgi:hypothetical protein